MASKIKPSLFFVSINYHASLEEIDEHMKGHMIFLKKYYANGHFLVSGRMIPRNGGIIIAKSKDKKELEKIMKSDPFYKNKLASFTIVQFQASQYTGTMKELL